jgi:hypothetical protein
MADTYVSEYAFTMEDEAYGMSSRMVGDEAFYEEVNRVLGNLKTIRRIHPNSGILVSFVKNAQDESFKITLT